jgi:hypothetical protein
MAEIDLQDSSHDRLTNGMSPWGQQGVRPSYGPLENNIKVDALVIGGGITGRAGAWQHRR